MIELSLLGNPNVTLVAFGMKGQPANKVMHDAGKRWAQQGAERVTVVPKRDGKGWTTKKEASDHAV
jgi:hypothetical protein